MYYMLVSTKHLESIHFGMTLCVKCNLNLFRSSALIRGQSYVV